MDNKELTTFIVHHLGDGVGKDEIIYQVCERWKMNWSDAEALVNQLLVTQGKQVARRQFPILLVASVGIILLGLGILAQTIISAIDLLRNVNIPPGSVSVIFVLSYLSTSPQMFWSLLEGVAILVGGMIGLYQASKNLL